MKTLLHLSALIFLLTIAAAPCFAMMSIAEVSPARAKELGIEVRSTPSGPDAAWIELAFETKGELTHFGRVSLEITTAGKLVLSSSLKEEKSQPGHVLVRFTAGRAQLDQMTLRIVIGDFDSTGYDLRLKDFVDLKKLAIAEEENRFLFAVRKAFDARDPALLDAETCWDGVPDKVKQDLQATYASLVAEKGAVFDFTLVDPDFKFIDRDPTLVRGGDGTTYRANLPITRKLSMKGLRPTDRGTLFILGFAVGQKDGKLVLLASAPVK